MRRAGLVGVLIIFSVLATFSLVSALPPLVVDAHSEDSRIRYNEVAEFQVELTNTQEDMEKIYISGPGGGWDISIDDYYVEIPGESSYTVMVRISPPSDVIAGTYGLLFKFNAEEDTAASTYKYIHVVVTEGAPEPEPKEVVTPVVPENLEIIEKFFADGLKKEYTATITNNGNGTVTKELTAIMTKMDLFFMKSPRDYTVTKEIGDFREVAWVYTLEPGASVRISYTVSYVPLAGGAVLLIVALILMALFYSSHLSITKKLILTKSPGPKAIKVELAIKNKTPREQKNVLVEDYIPVPFSLVDDFETIEPSSITKQDNKIKLSWRFPLLAPREERIISYEMKSKIRVVGKITLPQAVLRQKKGKKSTVIYSGTIDVAGK